MRKKGIKDAFPLLVRTYSLFVILGLVVLTLFVACKNIEKEEQIPFQEPKTSYGQSLKSAEDLSKSVVSNNRKIKEQAAKLADED
ncbi:MAG: hypothetical protein GYA55_09895 [SAR324 cluster bacterium]|uniref:Uncharacterized protein n=1 Tax=SAR324 cluster bacterium TaxID=2024889 RepID=A0A7X9IJV0_9DELT|nr:hypothetical protein [SAR324 cluster bacterium]